MESEWIWQEWQGFAHDRDAGAEDVPRSQLLTLGHLGNLGTNKSSLGQFGQTEHLKRSSM
jgi:hypothetical protein